MKASGFVRDLTKIKVRVIKKLKRSKGESLMEELRLSKVIKMEEHIDPYRVVQIIAGVGAGKNYWAGELIKKGYRVLLITSRAAIANAQAIKLGIDRWLDLEKIYESNNEWWEEDGKLKQSNVICTNAGIETFAKSQYDPNNAKTHLWNLFDFIILDEAHSVSADAAFSSAPFHVEKFLKHCYAKNKNLKIIFMTGTPDPMRWLMPEEQAAFKKWDFTKECINVIPERVVLDSVANMRSRIRHYYALGERIVYFANEISGITDLVKYLLEDGVPEKEIFVSFNTKDRDAKAKAQDIPKKIRKRMKEDQEYLEEKELLPDGIRFFLTTSKNKEGISINDKNVKIMFAEKHERCDLIQMAGRVREGLKYFCILYDAAQFNYDEYDADKTLSRAFLPECNSKKEDLFEKLGEREAVKALEKRFGYIRYNVFKGIFEPYKGKVYDIRDKRKDIHFFDSCIRSWNSVVTEDGKTGKEGLEKWFPDSSVDLYKKRFNEKARAYELVRNEIDTYLQKENVIDQRLDDKKYKEILKGVNELLMARAATLQIKGEYKRLKSALKYSSYVLKQHSHAEAIYKIEKNR